MVKLGKQFACRHTERFRQPFDYGDRGISRSTLDIADIRAMYAGFMGERFLAELHFVAETTNIPTKAFSDIHALAKAPM